MNRLLQAAYAALMLNPFISLAVVAPFIFREFRRTKRIRPLRSVAWYLLSFFLLCAFFMTQLPFPTVESVEKMQGAWVQLIPFYCVYDFVSNSVMDLSDWTTIFPALRSSIFLGVVLNVAMLLPAGFLFCQVTDMKSGKALLVGLGISLFFELVQLSGLFFIYPRPYRLFDVDDLIQNSFGFWLGFRMGQAAKRHQPKLSRKTEPLRQGGEISMRRRFAADTVDQGIALAVPLCAAAAMQAFLHAPVRSIILVCTALYAASLLILALITARRDGVSPGMRLMGLELEDSPSFTACAVRYLSFSVISMLPFIIYGLMTLASIRSGLYQVLLAACSAAAVFVYVLYLLSLLLYVMTHGEKLFHERLSHTRLGFRPSLRHRRNSRFLFTGTLNESDIEPSTMRLFFSMMDRGVPRRNAQRVRIFTEAILMDWLQRGLRDVRFELLLTGSRFEKTVVISVPGAETRLLREEDSFMETCSGTRLSYDDYYLAGRNIFVIEVP